jgi:hypothetical protein
VAEEVARRRRLFSDRRVKIALWIAVAEAIITYVKTDWTKWTIIIIAIPIVLFHLLAGRNLDSRLGRDISFTLALSQAFAVIAVIVASLFDTLVLVLAGIFAGVALLLLLLDRDRTARAK